MKKLIKELDGIRKEHLNIISYYEKLIKKLGDTVKKQKPVLEDAHATIQGYEKELDILKSNAKKDARQMKKQDETIKQLRKDVEEQRD